MSEATTEPITSPASPGRFGAAPRHPLSSAAERFGVLTIMVIVTGIFVVLRPSTFATMDNVKTILVGAAALAVISFGLTVVLVMSDFDLSFGAVVGLVSAVSISLMSLQGVAWPVAILVGLLTAAAVGTLNGVLTAYLGAAAFIVTLAVSTGATGVEYLITDQKSLYDGVPQAYANIGQADFLGLNVQVWIALVVFVVIYFLLDQTETGRRMYAIGRSTPAAALAGVRVQRMRMLGFVIAASLAGVAGIMVSAENAAYTPGQGVSLLLPAYAAAFLGTTVLRRNRFGAAGTLVGVVFLAIIQDGLTLLDIDTAWVNIAQCVILLGAILAARASRR